MVISSVEDSADIKVSLKAYYEHPVPDTLRSRILSLCRQRAQTTLEEVCDLNFELGDLFTDAVLASGINLTEIDIVACHGQTLWHNPAAVKTGAGYANGERRMATLQMAESAVLSKRTGLYALPSTQRHQADLSAERSSTTFVLQSSLGLVWEHHCPVSSRRPYCDIQPKRESAKISAAWAMLRSSHP